jgi:hypothetical protein
MSDIWNRLFIAMTGCFIFLFLVILLWEHKEKRRYGKIDSTVYVIQKDIGYIQAPLGPHFIDTLISLDVGK